MYEDCRNLTNFPTIWIINGKGNLPVGYLSHAWRTFIAKTADITDFTCRFCGIHRETHSSAEFLKRDSTVNAYRLSFNVLDHARCCLTSVFGWEQVLCRIMCYSCKNCLDNILNKLFPGVGMKLTKSSTLVFLLCASLCIYLFRLLFILKWTGFENWYLRTYSAVNHPIKMHLYQCIYNNSYF